MRYIMKMSFSSFCVRSKTSFWRLIHFDIRVVCFQQITPDELPTDIRVSLTDKVGNIGKLAALLMIEINAGQVSCHQHLWVDVIFNISLRFYVSCLIFLWLWEFIIVFWIRTLDGFLISADFLSFQICTARWGFHSSPYFGQKFWVLKIFSWPIVEYL